jgi:putative hemolysin
MGYAVIIGMLIFASGSFFFAAAESSLFSLGKWRARQLSARDPKGKLVGALLERPAELLATIALGNTIANSSIVALALWPALRGKWSPWLSIAGAFAVMLIGCEVIPKALALRKPEKWALRVARQMTLLQDATGWLQRLIQRFTDWIARTVLPKSSRTQTSNEEYRELLELAYQHGTLARSEMDLILQIINMDRKTVAEVMKPRSQMAAIPDDLSVEEMIEAAKRSKHSRLPMYDETPDTIVGILNTRTLLLDPQVDLADAIEFPSFVPKTMNLLELLKSFQRRQRGPAIVVDEFGGTAGLVTMEDILEFVVGEIPGEGEPVSLEIERISPGKWRVSGIATIEEFRREYPEIGEVPGVITMGGLLTSQLEVIPSAGESAVLRGLRLTAQAVDERQVKELMVEVVKRK